MQGRVSKFLSHAGVCSRRQAEILIQEGRVSVNGEVCDVGFQLAGGETICVDGKEITHISGVPRVWLYHKPLGCIVSEKDEKNRPTIFDNIRGLGLDLPRLMSVGRLDYNSEGLLLLTDNGGLARFLELPINAVERVYRVRVYGTLRDSDLARIRSGLEIEGIRYRPCDIEIEDDQPRHASNIWLRMVLQEGKNREIRRLFEFFGLRVSRLVRISYGDFTLNNLPQNALCEVKNPQSKLKKLSGFRDLFE